MEFLNDRTKMMVACARKTKLASDRGFLKMKIFGHPLVSGHLLGKTAVVSVDEGDSNSGGKGGNSGMSERDNVIMVGEEVSGGANEGDAMIINGGNSQGHSCFKEGKRERWK